MPSLATARRLRQLGALLLLVVAGVHFQQYVDFMSEVPTVGVLFLLNAAGGVGLLLAMLNGDRLIALLAMTGSIGLAIGSLVSIGLALHGRFFGIALDGNFYGYQEPTLRLPIVIAVVAEVLLVLVLLLPFVRNLRKSRIGRALVAVRDNETAAAVMGVNLKFTKTVTFGISAAIAGASGWLTAARLDRLDENSFTILNSIKYLLALFLGGAATLAGPIVGAFVYYFVDDYLKTHAPTWHWLPGPISKGPVASFLLGTIVIIFVFIAPFGLVGFIKDQVRRVFVVTPRPLKQAVTSPELIEHTSDATAAESSAQD